MEEENVEIKSAESGSQDLGKFKDVDALKKAYAELEAEFTRRSQRLKALEKSKAREDLQEGVSGERSKETPEEKPETAPSSERETESGSETLYRQVMESEEVRSRVLADYLRSLKGVPLMTTGRGVVAPAQKPKTIAEAGSLALGYLKNKK